MKTLLISYDLNSELGRSSYDQIIKLIKTYSIWAKPLESFWFIKTSKKITDVRDELKKLMDSDDELVILDVTNNSWATYGISDKVTNWMKNNL